MISAREMFNLVDKSVSTPAFNSNGITNFYGNLNQSIVSRPESSKMENAIVVSKKDSDLQREILSQFYLGEDFEDEYSRREISSLLSSLYPSYGKDFFYNNLDAYLLQATGFNRTPKSHMEHMSNVFKSSASSIQAGLELATFYLGHAFSDKNDEEFEEKKTKLLNKINKNLLTYKKEDGDEKYSGIFQRMLTETAAQAPQMIANIGIAGLGGAINLLTGGVGGIALAGLGNFAFSALSEGGATMLDMANAGFDDNTVLAMGTSVMLLSGMLETVGDQAILGPWKKMFSKNKSTVLDLMGKTKWDMIKHFGNNIAKEVAKSEATEIPTEIAQEVVGMYAYNLGLAIEHKYGRMEDILGYTKEDFAKAIPEIIKSTALSVPLMSGTPALIDAVSQYKSPNVKSWRDAIEYTKHEQGSTVVKATDIQMPTLNSKEISKKDIKNNPVEAIKYVSIGGEKLAINATEEQKAAVASSKYVFAKQQDFSILNIVKEEDIQKEQVIDLKTPLKDAYSIITKRFKKDHNVTGVSLLDENKNETTEEKDAKYIAVTVKDVAEPAVVSLGEEGSKSDFEKAVFGDSDIIDSIDPTDADNDNNENLSESDPNAVGLNVYADALNKIDNAIEENKTVDTEQTRQEKVNAMAKSEKQFEVAMASVIQSTGAKTSTIATENNQQTDNTYYVNAKSVIEEKLYNSPNSSGNINKISETSTIISTAISGVTNKELHDVVNSNKIDSIIEASTKLVANDNVTTDMVGETIYKAVADSMIDDAAIVKKIKNSDIQEAKAVLDDSAKLKQMLEESLELYLVIDEKDDLAMLFSDEFEKVKNATSVMSDFLNGKGIVSDENIKAYNTKIGEVDVNTKPINDAVRKSTETIENAVNDVQKQIKLTKEAVAREEEKERKRVIDTLRNIFEGKTFKFEARNMATNISEVFKKNKTNISSNALNALAMMATLMGNKKITFASSKDANLTEAEKQALADSRAIVKIAKLGKSAEIILSPEADASSVIHEMFHVVFWTNTSVRNALVRSFKTALKNEKEKLTAFYSDHMDIVQSLDPNYEIKTVDDVLNTLDFITEDNVLVNEAYEELLARTFEAFAMSNTFQRNSYLPFNIKELFQRVASAMANVYKKLTGKTLAVLPRGVETAFLDFLTNRESTENNTNNDFVVRRQMSIMKAIENSEYSTAAAREAGAWVFRRYDVIKIYKDIEKLLANNDDVLKTQEIILKYLEDNNVFESIKNFSEEAKIKTKNEIIKELADVLNTPSLKAIRLNNLAKSVQNYIDDGLYNSDFDYSTLSDKEMAIRKGRVTTANNTLNALVGLIDQMMNGLADKTTRYTRITQYLAIDIAKMGIAGNDFAEIAEVYRRRNKVTKDITPSQYVGFVRSFIDEKGRIRLLEDVSGYTWSPFMDMHAILNSDMDKFSPTRNNIRNADPEFLRYAYDTLYAIQGNANKIANPIPAFYDTAIEIMLDYTDEDMSILFDPENIEEAMTKIAMQETAFIKDVVETIQKWNKKDGEKAILDSLSAIENYISTQMISVARSNAQKEKLLNEFRPRLKELQSEIKKLRGEISEKDKIQKNFEIAIEAMEKLANDKIETEEEFKKVKEEVSKAFRHLKDDVRATSRNLRKAIERLQENAQKRILHELQRKKDNIISTIKIENSTKGCAAVIVNKAKAISNFIMQDIEKPIAIPNNMFDGPDRNFALFANLKNTLIKYGFIEKQPNGSYMLIKSVSSTSLSKVELGVLNDIATDIRDILKKGREEVLSRKKERESELKKSIKNVSNSFESLKNLSDDEREESVANYSKSRNLGSESQKKQDSQNKMQMFKSQFLSIPMLIKKLNPALYSMMFGGMITDENGTRYSGYNLNTAANNESKMVSKRTNEFFNKISELWGYEKPKYVMRRLFSKVKMTLGNMSFADFEADNGFNLNSFKTKDGKQMPAALKGLMQIKLRLEANIKLEMENIDALNKEVLELKQKKDFSKAEKKEQEIREAEKNLEGYKRQLFGEGSAIESEYTMQQLMGIYIQARVEYGIDRMSNHMSDTILSNNIGLHNIIWVYNEFLNNNEFDKYRQLAEFIGEKVSERYADTAEVFNRMTNGEKILEEIDMYFPARSEGNQGGDPDKISHTLQFSLFSNYDSADIDDSHTHERNTNLAALDLDVVDNYMSAIRKQEHYIAFAEVTDDFSNMLADDGDIAKTLRYAFKDKPGEAEMYIGMLKTYLAKIKDNSEAVDATAGFFAKLRSNFAISKLFGNISSAILQLPTYALVISRVGLVNATTSLVKYFHMKKTGDIDQLINDSPQIKERVRYEIAEYRSLKTVDKNSLLSWAEAKLGKDFTAAKEFCDKTIDFGMGLIEYFDSGVTKAMYYALFEDMYEKKLNDPNYKAIFDKSPDEYRKIIIEEASQELLSMVPSQNVKDNALIYSNHDTFFKNMLVFTSQLNKQFNLLYGDLVDVDWTWDTAKRAISSFMTLGLVSACATLISGYAYPADDEEDKWNAFASDLLLGTLGEMASGIPLVGSTFKDLVTGNNYAETNLAQEAMTFITKIKSEDVTLESKMTTFTNMTAEALTLAGAPATILQKGVRVAKALADDPSFGDLGYLINAKTGKFTENLGE